MKSMLKKNEIIISDTNNYLYAKKMYTTRIKQLIIIL